MTTPHKGIPKGSTRLLFTSPGDTFDVNGVRKGRSEQRQSASEDHGAQGRGHARNDQRKVARRG